MINLFLCDIDGCLTDGRYLVYRDGDMVREARSFHTRDFHGLQLAHERGMMIAVVTASSNVVVEQFKRAAPYATVHCDVRNKLAFVESVYGKLYDWNETAFIGDDVLDVELLVRVGVAACPADAEEFVRNTVSYRKDGFVLSRNGGHGCVREFINLLLEGV